MLGLIWVQIVEPDLLEPKGSGELKSAKIFFKKLPRVKMLESFFVVVMLYIQIACLPSLNQY